MLTIFIPNFNLRISFHKIIFEYEIKSGSKCLNLSVDDDPPIH